MAAGRTFKDRPSFVAKPERVVFKDFVVGKVRPSCEYQFDSGVGGSVERMCLRLLSRVSKTRRCSMCNPVRSGPDFRFLPENNSFPSR